ncbi:hypothetical protein L226DRAFT_209220 [Lentinus tigrinus ALCF2SS1-7]|uniref:uncharacterized protein n=1 Tax=Lentinus tigrinus ALCF2SS1-7 TaxID=1328758 RepID=UPI001165FA77|nr:hypothetical protein L226DRAFT_209220 [Lentinus tigrinus ALCF2SS1-7]
MSAFTSEFFCSSQYVDNNAGCSTLNTLSAFLSHIYAEELQFRESREVVQQGVPSGITPLDTTDKQTRQALVCTSADPVARKGVTPYSQLLTESRTSKLQGRRARPAAKRSKYFSPREYGIHTMTHLNRQAGPINTYSPTDPRSCIQSLDSIASVLPVLSCQASPQAGEVCRPSLNPEPTTYAVDSLLPLQ